MKLMRLPRLSLALWLLGVPLGAVGGPRGATAAPASPAAAAAPSTPTAPQPALPGEPGLPQQSPAEPPGQPLPAQQAAAVEGNPDWADTLERIAGSVVSIDVDSTRAFDTEWNSSAQATGFVVDAERGLILTNRHVVTPGPVTAEATFLNREEVQLYPVYRDPVHDFGIYRYNPQKLRFIKPKALQLYPEGAQIGREFRVVGNNADLAPDLRPFGIELQRLGLDEAKFLRVVAVDAEVVHRIAVHGIELNFLAIEEGRLRGHGARGHDVAVGEDQAALGVDHEAGRLGARVPLRVEGAGRIDVDRDDAAGDALERVGPVGIALDGRGLLRGQWLPGRLFGGPLRRLRLPGKSRLRRRRGRGRGRCRRRGRRGGAARSTRGAQRHTDQPESQ